MYKSELITLEVNNKEYLISTSNELNAEKTIQEILKHYPQDANINFK